MDKAKPALFAIGLFSALFVCEELAIKEEKNKYSLIVLGGIKIASMNARVINNDLNELSRLVF